MRLIALAACAVLLTACSLFDGDDTTPATTVPAPTASVPAPAPTTTAQVGTSSSGGSFFGLFGGGGSDDAGVVSADGSSLGVNAYLWRASLDTLNFMPLTSEDPVGGVIITDWYSAPENPNERMKVTTYILDRRLRADALKVAVFRQTRTANGWVDAQVNADTPVKLENAILTRARQLHLGNVQ